MPVIIPAFQRLGLQPASELTKVRRLMIGTDGWTNSGKTEFGLSAPGPIVILPVDCSYDSMLDNPHPPKWRDLTKVYFDDIKIPNSAQVASTSEYAEHFKKYRARLYELLAVPDIRTLVIDGDSDSWELQLLSEFGRLTQIHPMSYPIADGMRRYMIKKCWWSRKIIIGTNKIKDKYEDVLDDDGNPIKEDGGRNKQRKVPGEYKRQGFRDQDYLWQLQIRHLYKGPEKLDLSEMKPIERLRAVREGKHKTEPEWGLRIMKCKVNPRLEGDELWGNQCNFAGLVQYVYPQVPLYEWGFPRDYKV